MAVRTRIQSQRTACQQAVGARSNISGCLDVDCIRQPETFAKPKTQQEIVNAPSFPRRQKSWLNLRNGLFLRRFLNIKQDSRLRGNDGISCVSGCC
ncbi:hypothetical protein [Kingella sp. (in: b-proteobacteria)]|uniref:hypothetical protein n=1 Tax=Kingella sp. (in: b-proteobacteria) TaxID=2020713 RepID=UPI0026DCC92F|nr:hypothetical protein [Kingella sp. (in: b-proteobacteria)]MDO4657333.1 hypothetical protein [Kingella sp. (in: b-proteobacteria)]